MIVAIQDINLTNVWQESFTDRQTGEKVEYNRALLNKTGEPPLQIGLHNDDYETVSEFVGMTGTALIDLDAQPGRRAKVTLKGFEG